MTSLFLDPMVFEKKASSPLEEDPALWGRQVLVELFRQVPEAAEYSPQFMMYKMDEEQGFGLGSVILKSVVDSALRTPERNPGPQAIVPVIIENYRLKPMDVMYGGNGKALPLTADRIKQTLFRPDMFESMASESDLGSLYNVFYPPGRSDNSFGSGYGQPLGGSTGGMNTVYGPGMQGKYSMLEAVGPTLLAPDLQKLATTMEGHPHYLEAMQGNEAFLGAVQTLADYQKMASDGSTDYMKSAAGFAPITVTQIGYDEDAEQYWVKSASSRAYSTPHVVWLDRAEFLKLAGEEATKRVDTEGTVTMTHAPSVEAPEISTTEVKWEPVTSPGVYRVKTPTGAELTGWVIPSLVDVDGHTVPLAVFSNGSATAVQDIILGVRVAESQHLPLATPKGQGLFFVTTADGIRGTIPLTVKGSEAAMDGSDAYHVVTNLGQKATVRMVEGLRSIVASKGELLLPAHAGFMALSGENLPLASSPDQVMKVSSAETAISALWLNDGTVRLQYRNLPKLASTSPATVSIPEAFWHMGLAGMSAKHAADVMTESASTGYAATAYGVHDVTLLSDIAGGVREKAASNTHRIFAMREDLLKEASVLPTSSTVDAVLSLQFLNSENIRMFISKLPYLEECLNTLCELLIAQRLGLQQLPEGALTRAVRGLDAAIGSLRGMAMSPDNAEA